MRVKILISALVCLLCITLTYCGFVSFVKNPDTSLEATKNEYITILRGMCDENDYSEEERREYVKLLLEIENLIREAKDHEAIVAIFEQYSLILGNIPLNIELVRARITIQMKELAAANVYREEEQRSVDWLLWYFGSTLDECEDVDRCEGILLEFKTSLANIKTDAQLYAEELATIKNELSASFGENLDYSIYRAEQKAELEKIVKEFKTVLLAASTHGECDRILSEYTDKVIALPIASELLGKERTEWIVRWQEILISFAERYSLNIYSDITDTLLLILEQENEGAADACGSRFILEKAAALGEDAFTDMKSAALTYVSSFGIRADGKEYRTAEAEILKALALDAEEKVSRTNAFDDLCNLLTEVSEELLAVPTNEELWQEDDLDFYERMKEKYGSYMLLPPESLTVANSVDELARIIDYYAFYQLDGKSFERGTFRVKLNFSHKYAEWIIRDVYWCCELLRSAVGISGEFDGDSSNLVITLHPYDIATVTNENRLEGAKRYDSLIEYTPSGEHTDRAEDFEDFPYLEKYAGRYVTVWNSQQLWYALEKEYIPLPLKDSPAEAVLTSAKEILREIIKDGMSIEEKIFAIYSWYSDNVYYDYAYEDKTYVEDRANFPDSEVATLRSFHAEGALLDKLAVCCSYAKSTLILMRLEGIEAYRVILHLYSDNAIDNHGEASYGSHAIIALRGSDGKFYYCDTEQCAAGDSLKYEKYMQLMVTAEEQCPYNNAIDRIWNGLDYSEKFPMKLFWDGLTYNGKSVFVDNEKELKAIIDEFCALGDKTKQINIFTFDVGKFDVKELLDLDERIEYFYAGLGEFYEYMISYVGDPE